MLDDDLPDPRAGIPAAGLVTVTGEVVAGVEWGSLLLHGYQLIGGPRALLRAGARVRVTGEPAPDLLTTAQQGTPLLVRHVEPL